MKKIDTKKLIEEVKKRPALWDMTQRNVRWPTNRSSMLKYRCWSEITEVFAEDGITEEEKNELAHKLRTKWETIRAKYKKELRKYGKSKGPTTHLLQFLRDKLELKETISSNKQFLQGSCEQQPSSSEDATSFAISMLSEQTVPVAPVLGKRSPRSHPAEKRTKLDKNKSGDDDTRHFLLSLLPTLSSLPKRLNTKCRLELMKVVNKYEEYAFIEQDQDTLTCATAVPTGVAQEARPLYHTVQGEFCNTYQSEMTELTSPAESLSSNISNFSEDSNTIIP